jgi:DNA-binding CsgD family transcriptional regulator
MLLDFLERMGCGGVLLDSDASVIRLNGTARTILQEITGSAFDADDHAAAQRKLEQMFKCEVGRIVRADEPIVIAIGERWPVVASTMRSGLPGDDSTAIILVDLNRHPELDTAILQKTFELTAAEANVAICIARGLTLTRVSDLLGVSLHTVRGHLAATFSKTHTRRQAELTALLARLAVA